MQDLARLHQLSAEQHRAGNLAAAEQGYRQILALAPEETAVRRDLAWLLAARGEHAAAIEELALAIRAAPQAAMLHVDVGTMLSKAGRLEEAVHAFLRALQLESNNLIAWFNLGNCQSRMGRLEEAVASYRHAQAIAPADIDVLLNLGVTQKDLGQLAESRQTFEQVLRLSPKSAEAWVNLGLLAKLEADYEQAIDCYNQALALNPRSAVAYNNRGSVLQSQGQLDAAIADYQQALAIAPNYAKALGNLGEAYLDQGEVSQAIGCLERAILGGAGDAQRIKVALAMSPIIPSLAEIERTHRRIAEQLGALEGLELAVTDPVQDIGSPSFYLAYLGCNERETQARFARLMRRAAAVLDYCAPHCASQATRPRQTQLRVGFASTFFWNHTIGKLNAGLIEQLDRKRFEVFVFSGGHRQDLLAQRIQAAADTSVRLSAQLSTARHQIAEHELDILYYADIGMAPLTYYLAHARLAAVQCVTWGHPLTTGLPTIDYFISSRHLESPGSPSQYTERLVALEHLTNYYFRPAAPAGKKTRADFGFDDNLHWYVCPQSLFKLHPLDDDAWRRILELDPLARIVLIEGQQPAWNRLLRRRWEQSLGQLAERVVFIPRQPSDDFVQLLAAADVLLDPLMFGGGNTSYEAFAVGAPVVTLPGEFLRNRITYAQYRQMGVLDCIAKDVDDYADIAVRLASDPNHRQHVRQKILAAGDRIYENAAAVRELEQFFLQAAARATN